MKILEWMAFGIGSQVLSLPVAAVVGALAFWLHGQSSQKKSYTAFLLPCLVCLAGGVWFSSKGMVVTHFLDFNSPEQLTASQRLHQKDIDTMTLRVAVFPALLFAIAAFVILAIRRPRFQWGFGATVFFGMCLYLGFLDHRLIERQRGSKPPSAPPSLAGSAISTLTRSKVFRSDTERVSFRYPENWEAVASQAKTTLVLLHARDGSSGTCNLSVIPSDRPSAKDFDHDYFLSIFSRLHKDAAVKLVRHVELLGESRAFVDANFTLEMPSGPIPLSTITMATVHNGKRYMLVLNAPRDQIEKLRAVFDVIAGTLVFDLQ